MFLRGESSRAPLHLESLAWRRWYPSMELTMIPLLPTRVQLEHKLNMEEDVISTFSLEDRKH